MSFPGFLKPNPTTLTPHESELVKNMISMLKTKMQQTYKPGTPMLRDAHPKGLALLKGQLTVLPQDDPALRVGMFARPGTFQATIRASNAQGEVASDSVPDMRGFAIKLDNGQDFVLLSHHVMPLGTVQLFHDGIKFVVEQGRPWLFMLKAVLTGHLSTVLALKNAAITPDSPLAIPYYSTTPYRFGNERVVKYILRPTSTYHPPPPAVRDDSYLSKAVATHLANAPATFDLYVQFGLTHNTTADSFEDWSGNPETKVATLVIPKQVPSPLEQGQIAFKASPANALPEHVPLGPLNLARTQIYQVLSEFRTSVGGSKL